MIKLAIVGALMMGSLSGAPVATGDYRICRMAFADGTSIGVTSLPCAATGTRSGIQIKDTDGLTDPIQACDLKPKTNVAYCFTYTSTPETIIYHVRAR